MKPEWGYMFILSEKKSKLAVYYQDLFNYLSITRLYRVGVIKSKLWSACCSFNYERSICYYFCHFNCLTRQGGSHT